MVYSFEINEDLLLALDEYHDKSMLMEKHKIEKNEYDGCLESAINDDLIYNVPIYDMGRRRYAAFCSLLEALKELEKDPKGNGKHFVDHQIKDDKDWIFLFYLFRLCGSGINYKPKKNNTLFESDFRGTHGFGNFWVVDSILNGKYTYKEWLSDLKTLKKPFTDNKGYLLPQFSFSGLEKDHLKYFILNYSEILIDALLNFIHNNGPVDIYQFTDKGNEILKKLGFKRQNFVLTATAADLLQYYPSLINRNGLVYAGTNAVRCIKAIFPKKKDMKTSEFDYVNDVLQFQSNRYNLSPIDCEDSRNCDVVRYFQEYQSKDHILNNQGVIMKNNSILKRIWGRNRYYDFSNKLK